MISIRDLTDRFLDRFASREWREHLARAPVKLLSGETVDGWVWRRRINGAWQYREMSEADQTEQVWHYAIK